MDSNYMILPSNVIDITNKNKIGNYTVNLPQTQNLNNHEIGIVEIFISKSWFNIPSSQFFQMRFKTRRNIMNNEYIEMGSYSNIEQLVTEINKKLFNLSNIIETENKDIQILDYPEVKVLRRHVYIQPGKTTDDDLFHPVFPLMITEMLGLKPNHSFNEGEPIYWTHDKDYDLDASIHTIYVYCDVIKPSIVGDSLQRVLRVINVPDISFRETIHIVYSNPIYYTIEKKEFKSIEIDIKDSTGETLKFKDGRVIVVLHCRRKNE